MRKTKLLKNGLVRIGNTGIYVSVFSFLSAFFILISDISVYTLIVLFSVMLHEAGHIFALNSCGIKPKKICVYPFGIDMRCDTSRISYYREFFVMLSGAAANLISCVISLAICIVAYSRTSLFVAFCNAFLGITNLIPISGLDGGRALYALLCMHFQEEKVCRICRVVSNLSYVIMSIAFLSVIIYTKANFSMIIMLSFFAMGAVLASHLLK